MALFIVGSTPSCAAEPAAASDARPYGSGPGASKAQTAQRPRFIAEVYSTAMEAQFTSSEVTSLPHERRPRLNGALPARRPSRTRVERRECYPGRRGRRPRRAGPVGLRRTAAFPWRERREAGVAQFGFLRIRPALPRRSRFSNHGAAQPFEELLDAREGPIRFSEQIDGDAVSIFAAACEHGLEGVIFKDPDSPYRSRRTGDRIEVKCIQSVSFFVAGYEKSAVARGRVGSLLLAARPGDDLQYVESVGMGSI